jgi:D-alanine-D-alanine ligase
MLTIALIYGGQSAEHSVSCVTALGVLSAIDQSKYRVIQVGITKSGRFADFPVNRDWTLAQHPEVSASAPEISFTPAAT